MTNITTNAHANSAVTRIREIWSMQGRHGILHRTWFAFFLTFVVWFNFAPFAGTIGAQLGFTKEQLQTLALCNVALTVPARIIIGMLLDRIGPRRTYAGILIFATIPCLVFAFATSFTVAIVSRLALSIVGAGFVVGIRMVSEWFPPREIGLAEGVYGGWGNFGSAAAAITLPTLAAWIGGEAGWRFAIATTGIISGLYGFYFLRAVSDTPDGGSYQRPKRQGALEVTSRSAVRGLIALCIPLTGVLMLVAWRIYLVGALTKAALLLCMSLLFVVGVVHARRNLRVNHSALAGDYPVEDQYPFRSVVVLCLAYLVTFGSEIAVVSMLPTFFGDTWNLSPAAAGATASAYAFMNLVARPAGGLLSDLLGSRRRTLRGILACLGIGYLGMAALGSSWPVLAAIVVTMACSLFVQAGEGAVYAIVPLVKKRVGGQIAGIVGAYGNIGGILYLTMLLLVGPAGFFLVIAASALVVAIVTRWLPEPRGSFDDQYQDDRRVSIAAIEEPSALLH